jgi:hypothetical protein
MSRQLFWKRERRKYIRPITIPGSVAMKMRGSRLLGLMSVAWLLNGGVAMAAADNDPLSGQRDAYVRSSLAPVAGVPAEAMISSVDPLGDHRIGVYTVDGSHEAIWLVTTDEQCPQPVLSGNKIVSLVPDGAPRDCHSVTIRPVDKNQLRSRLFALKSHQLPVLLITDPPRSRWDLMLPPPPHREGP